MQVSDLVTKINQEAGRFRFGKLQEIRRHHHGLHRRPSVVPFPPSQVKDHYAFHRGGRTELQFNVGLEGARVRYGVAFAFQLDRTLRDHEEMYPKVERFNEFLRLHPDELSGLAMWDWSSKERSRDRTPGMIHPKLLSEGAFVFLGHHEPREEFDADRVLELFDRLLPLYEFVEGVRSVPAVSVSHDAEFTFVPGHSRKVAKGVHARTADRISVEFRHNRLQDALVDRLRKEHGEESVASECGDGLGGRIDVVLKEGDEFDFFEIKVGSSARSCIRQAMGQLLEYGLWPRAQRPRRLVVVGEPDLDPEAARYLNCLRTEFGLPLHYEAVPMPFADDP